MQLELQHASRVPLLRTPPRGFCSSSYKHATPNGVKTVNVFFQGFVGAWGFCGLELSSSFVSFGNGGVQPVCSRSMRA